MTRPAILLAISCVPAAAAYNIRLWFSTEGAAEGGPISGTPAEWIDPWTGINPTIDASSGAARLYIWGSTDAYAIFYYVGLGINIHSTAGEVSLSDFGLYNIYSTVYPSVSRWGSIDEGTVSAGGVEDASMLSIDLQWGLTPLRAVSYGDVQFDPATNSMLLGYLDLAMTPGATGEVFFLTGLYGGGTFENSVYLGWGDAPFDMPYDPVGVESELADAIIIPEPAALLLLAAAAVVLRRRSAAGRRPCLGDRPPPGPSVTGRVAARTAYRRMRRRPL